MQSAFQKFLKRYGTDVLVTTRTPQLDGEGKIIMDDDKEEPAFDSEDNTFKAVMELTNTNERNINDVIFKPKSDKALFPFRSNIGDNETPNWIDTINYLNTDSYITYDTLKGLITIFKIEDITERKTHWEVLIKKDE